MLLIFLSGATVNGFAQNVDVTFSVNMTGYDASQGIYITSELNDRAFTEMTLRSGTNIYDNLINIEISPLFF
jgi:hypothetical protein